MTRAIAYIWWKEKVIELPGGILIQDLGHLPVNIRNCPMVDTHYSDPEARVGQFIREHVPGSFHPEEQQYRWKQLTPEDLPSEFRTHLLLLGITP